MGGELNGGLSPTQRRQHEQQLQQQQQQQLQQQQERRQENLPDHHHGPGLPEKQHQVRHNPVADSLAGEFHGADQ